MSGDIGFKHEPIIFYCDKMTLTKKIYLEHKGIEYNQFKKVMKKINKLNN
tara:strand:- start:300 stop:449 length:150 start_codon:yes stop_codon:yes gene_type:complete